METNIPIGDTYLTQSGSGNGIVNGEYTPMAVVVEDKTQVVSNDVAISCCERCRNNFLCEKLVYTATCASLMFLAAVCFTAPWLVLYFYTALAPPLLAYRLYSYTKLRWHLFLLDFCYFVNIFCFAVIWAIPSNTAVFQVLFSLTHGPVLLATVLFRNSMVLHDIDRLTSSFIHILPTLCTFLIRWYPEQVSAGWYTSFTYQYDETKYLLVWLYAVPVAAYLVHMFLFILLVEVCIKPDSNLWYSFSYLSGKPTTWYGRFIHCCGEKHIRFMFYFWNWILSMLEVATTWLTYKFFVASCVFHLLCLLVIIWNGGTYYIDIFGRKTLQKARSATKKNQEDLRNTFG